MSFAESLRGHRLRCGLSQEELAAATGVAVRSLRNLEAGRVGRPRPSTVRLLADAFDLKGDEREAFTALALVTGADPAPAGPAPAQLPRDVSGFVGRDGLLRGLWALLDRNTLPLVSGTGGVGKTTLAVHWAHQAADRFPDGQLYVNLHGFGPGGAAAKPEDVLADFLAALGVARPEIPATTAGRATLYRSTLATRRVLVVLDNARDADQVRDLLPGGGASRAVVTSRDRLVALIAAEGAAPVPLDMLAEQEARDLLAKRLGADRIEAETVAVTDIVARCDRLPLALAVVAARAAVEPDLPLAALAGELRRPGGPLQALSAGDDRTDVRAVFSWSYRALPERTQEVFRVLGLHPGPDLDLYAAANLAGLDLEATRAAMAELIRLHLVNPRPAQRYGMHDLLRAYAGEVARAEMPEADRRAAHTRLNAFYQHTVYSLRDLLFPRGLAGDAPEPAVPIVFDSTMERETWAESERANLVATVVHASRNGLPEYVDAMTFALWLWLYHGGYSTDCLAISNAALHAARESGNRKAEASALNHAAGALMTLGRYAETAAYAEQSLELTRQLDDRRGQGRMLSNLAEVYTALGRSREAKRCGDEGLAIRRTLGSPTVEADGLTALTTLCLNLGLLDEAMSHAAEALAKYDSRKDLPWERTEALNNLARVQLRLGQVQQADEHLREALAIARPGSQGDKFRAETLILLGTSCMSSGAIAEAATHLSEALLLARAIGDPELLTMALAGRSRVRLAQGRIADGVSDARDAVTISTDAGHRRCEMIAHNVLGELLSHTDDRAEARQHLDTALAIATEIEDPYEQELARTRLSLLQSL